MIQRAIKIAKAIMDSEHQYPKIMVDAASEIVKIRRARDKAVLTIKNQYRDVWLDEIRFMRATRASWLVPKNRYAPRAMVKNMLIKQYRRRALDFFDLRRKIWGDVRHRLKTQCATLTGMWWMLHHPEVDDISQMLYGMWRKNSDSCSVDLYNKHYLGWVTGHLMAMVLAHQVGHHRVESTFDI